MSKTLSHLHLNQTYFRSFVPANVVYDPNKKENKQRVLLEELLQVFL
jgi:hypothetical protein